MSTEIAETNRVSERDRMIANRFEQALKIGYDNLVAASLASQMDWDIHELTRLVRKGCPLPLALDVARPL